MTGRFGGRRPPLQFARMKLTLCGLIFFAQIAHGSLEKYSSLIVADKDPGSSPPTDSIRITYLGVNGFQFENGGHALLVDPYFTRVGLWAGALNQGVESNPNRVSDGLRHVRPNIDAILVTHAHFDHLLDVPEIMRQTHARLISGPTAVRLVESVGISREKCETVKPGSIRRVGPFTVRILAAQHDRLFGKVPFPEKATLSKPVKASDWVVGEPLAFLIEAAGKRIYIDSGGIPRAPPRVGIGRVDLAILGVALPDSRKRFGEAVKLLKPRYILPSHQDDMFGPMNHGFVFGKMTSFPALLNGARKENLPGRVILLDYFKPWTVP